MRTADGRPQATEVLWEFGSLENAARWGRKEDDPPGLPFKSIPCSSLPWVREMLGEGTFVPARQSWRGLGKAVVPPAPPLPWLPCWGGVGTCLFSVTGWLSCPNSLTVFWRKENHQDLPVTHLTGGCCGELNVQVAKMGCTSAVWVPFFIPSASNQYGNRCTHPKEQLLPSTASLSTIVGWLRGEVLSSREPEVRAGLSWPALLWPEEAEAARAVTKT